MASIQNIFAREILDSRGNPTIEVDVLLSEGTLGRAAVPSGASTGAHEANELRDRDKRRYYGKGVLTACQHVREVLLPLLKGSNVEDLRGLDQKMLEADGTPNKSKLGANAILAVSLALARAAAWSRKQPLDEYLSRGKGHTLPVPLMNVLNGGAHANNGLDVQEFMIVPVLKGPFSESLRAGSEIFHALKGLLDAKGFSTAVGDEGGFAPGLKSNREALEFLALAVEKAGYRLGEDVGLALDVAATELLENSKYNWDGEILAAEELLDLYQEWSRAFPIWSIEDGFAEDDWTAWAKLTNQLGSKVQIVGDDLFVTNVQRLERGIKEKSANSILIKVNQIGSLSETSDAIELAKRNGFSTVMSHRSGETEDSIIADLAVGLGCPQIKTGSLSRGERTAKYNQLLRIQERLGSKAGYLGKQAFVQFGSQQPQ